MPKYTADDVRNLANSFRDAKDRGRAFNLLTGGGCSYTAGVPLAPELVRIVKEKYGGHVRKRVHPDRLDDYGACMGCLTTSERRDLLKPHLDKARVNWAHLAIASLMESGYVSRVLTFNFDQVLARACGICGLYPAVYDFGVAASSTLSHIVSPAIIHLHGQGYGLSLMNSDEETSRHAEALEPLLRETFERYPVLIIGYSGTADAVFPKIASSFSGRERLYWADKMEEPNFRMKELVGKASWTSDYYGGAGADILLVELAQALECWPPLLFREPEGHLLREIEPILDYPRELGGTDDLIGHLRSTLGRARKRRKVKDKRTFEGLMLEGKWDELISKESAATSEVDRNAVAWAYIMKGNSLSEFAAQKQDEKLFRDSFIMYAKALDLKPNMHEALNEWGFALSRLARQKKDKSIYDESFAKYAEALSINPNDHDVFANWGNTLWDLARLKNDASLFRQSISKYSRATQLKPDLYTAHNNWGNALAKLAELTGDESQYRESFAKYAEALRIAPGSQTVLGNWANALMGLWRIDKKPELLLLADNLLNQGDATSKQPKYNLACLRALQGRLDDCKAELELCKVAGTLPPREHVVSDPDLAVLHETQWFKNFLP